MLVNIYQCRYDERMKKIDLAGCCNPVAPAIPAARARELERLFRALGDRHRVQILAILLAADDAVCVCELVPALGLAQPTVSYHLKQLVDAGLLERERRGTFAYYRVTDDAAEWLAPLLAERVALASRG